MTIWYTADPHFGHANIIDYCNRPYTSVEQMDAALLANLIECVQPDDDLWIIGDFCFASKKLAQETVASLFSQIPGRKHLIAGNHDHSFTKELPWDSVQDYAEVKDGDQRFVLCHYPLVTWNGIRHGVVQLFGHVHDSWLGSRNCMNVGVDVWEFKPVQARQILATARALPKNDLVPQAEPGFDFD